MIEWEVPEYEISFWTEKKRNYAVVIPVINEGVRIHNLLDRMKEECISSLADIIIVDGGSTDGSLEIDDMKRKEVSGVLLKTARGKLSAQLRCAYAFVLEKGYSGIVTIDGNNKDDPVAIPKFIELLDKNYDFVQASRFVEGGEAENTPIVRELAIKIFHAPLLSLFSGFKWTDTTQGFRAYSSCMLKDPNISIFREVFSSYELLAYLNYRAPRLGFKCIELGTSRRYPPGEVPTKISGFKGNLVVLRTLVLACLGRYNPTEIGK
jgi:glycosyltransferase involved in cell wall biosynthesis